MGKKNDTTNDKDDKDNKSNRNDKNDKNDHQIPMQGPTLSTHPHPDYYLSDGNLHFLAERTHFKVHAHFFLRESRFWHRELLGPSSSGGLLSARGTSDSNAIVLEEKAEDFEQLLWVWYQTSKRMPTPPIPSDYDRSTATLQNWITILRYCTKWDFPKIKNLAIQYLETFDMDTVEKVILYQENFVPEIRLFPLYMKLASREERLGLAESRALGFDTIVLVHEARERLRAPPSENHLLSPIRTDLKHTDVIDIVASTFNIPLKEIGSDAGNTVHPVVGDQATLDEAAKVRAGGRGAVEEVEEIDGDWTNASDTGDGDDWGWETGSDVESSASEDFVPIARFGSFSDSL
ncbi:hypothetical protein P691DRAFT_785726 [Macrolepiota fuliginosa MF-IS2]|uniref:BTB domain-containing protein n=1 Tax=Macrolepiota fuliginosa MF-IS2 TaxID=1400762 RepID=A0A9P5X952_9AGAR|nr:hypothetical protein P691DRAFT_785726 [Macrolepiota fuliginosa MF-IS2]